MIRSLWIILGLFSLNATGQITIESKHMPSSGDTIRYSTTVDPTIDLSTTGASTTWDFTDLGLQSQGLNEYKDSWKTPYILNFGFTAIGLKVADTIGSGELQLKNVYTFFNKKSSAFESVGIGFQYAALPLPQAGKHSDPDRVYKFPLTYQDRDTDSYAVTVPISIGGFPVGKLIRSGTRTSIVDGWGKISTPYKSNVNCIRIVSVIDSYDSINISTLNVDFALPTKTVEYKWLSVDEKIPMLEVTGTEVAGNFVPGQIRYRDIPRKITPPGGVTALFTCNNTQPLTGEVITFTNQSEGFQNDYTWIVNGPGAPTYENGTSANSENPQMSFTDPGDYDITLIADGILEDDTLTKSAYITVKRGAGIEKGHLQLVRVFPNPAFSTLSVDIKTPGIYEYRITDILGATVRSGYVNGKHFSGFVYESSEIFIQDLAPGSYNFEIIGDLSKYKQTFIKK